MEDTQIIQWCLDNHRLLTSTQRPTREEAETVFKIANLVDSTQTHKMTQCGRCYENAKKAIRINLPTLFQ